MDMLSEHVCLAIDHDKQFQANVDHYESWCGLCFTCSSVAPPNRSHSIASGVNFAKCAFNWFIPRTTLPHKGETSCSLFPGYDTCNVPRSLNTRMLPSYTNINPWQTYIDPTAVHFIYYNEYCSLNIIVKWNIFQLWKRQFKTLKKRQLKESLP